MNPKIVRKHLSNSVLTSTVIETDMVNWDRIFELRDEVGEDDLSEVIEMFCEEVEEVLVQLDGAKADQLPGHLHFLKGSALNIGLEAVSNRCLSEENRLKGDPNATPDIAAIRADYTASKTELQGLF